VIFFSFISPRSSCGNEAAALTAKRADDDDFTRVDEAIDDEADFTFPVRAPDEDRLIDYPPRVQKVDLVFAKVAPALSSHSNALMCANGSSVVSSLMAPAPRRNDGARHVCSPERAVRDSGREESAHTYIQMYVFVNAPDCPTATVLVDSRDNPPIDGARAI
jgi:hypothetical protein